MSTRVMFATAAIMIAATFASAQPKDLASALRESQKLREENARLKAENEQTKRRIEELRKRAHGDGIKAVAVVDVIKAFNALIEKTEFDADFKGKGDEAIEEDRKKRERVKLLQKKLDDAVLGTESYNKVQSDLDDAVLEHQLWLAGEQGKLLSRRNQRMEEIYNKIMESVGVVAKAQKYDQVMLKEPSLSLIGATPDQVAAMIRSRKILWSTDDLDLTDLVVKYMNDEYVKNQRSAGE